MKVTFDLFWVVVLVVIIHTILQHLINWGFRVVARSENDEGNKIMSVLTVTEAVVLIIIL